MLLFLNRLSESRVPWGIATNGGESQGIKLAAANLDWITPFMVVSYEFGSRKPGAPIYQEAMRRLNSIPAKNSLFVGDDPVNDIVVAQGMGTVTAWVCLGDSTPKECQRLTL